MVTVFVRIQNVYGVDRIYPDCPITEIFASIAKTKTLSHNDLENIIKLGYKIEGRSKTVYKQFGIRIELDECYAKNGNFDREDI